MFKRRTLCTITIANLCIAADPCAGICALIPRACVPGGSRCLGLHSVCSDLNWFAQRLILCNHSDDGWNESMLPLTCHEAYGILECRNADAVTSYQSMVSAPRRGGRRGFEKGTLTSQYQSVLQVLLHSRALLRALLQELQSGDILENRTLFSFLSLVNRMDSDGGEGALDLTEFRSAIEESVWVDDSIDTPLEVLGVFLEEIAHVSMFLASALTWDLLRSSDQTSGSTDCVAGLVGFPALASDRSRWSIKELLEAHFEEIGLERIAQLPELLSIAIDRYPGGSPERRSNSFVETPMEIDLAGGGDVYRYRLTGIVREINDVYVADYFDSRDWIHTNGPHLHVNEGQPRNGGADCVLVFYETI